MQQLSKIKFSKNLMKQKENFMGIKRLKKEYISIMKDPIENLETHQIPTRFYFTDKIPKTFLGKIDRKSV